MTPSVQTLCDWLAATPLSTEIQSVEWVIPTIQTIHILAIAIVMSAASMVYLHTLGIVSQRQRLVDVAQRFFPWIWWTLIVLVLTGATLIVGEPARSLPNPVFILKMSLLAVALILAMLFQGGLRRDSLFWQSSPGRRICGRLIAAVSLTLWVGIVFAGRWIAYADFGSG